MKKSLILAASLLAVASTAMATDVGVSISVGEPGFYGRLDIGNFPQPQVVNVQPVIVQRPVRYVEQAPIYLRVPPGHAKHWSKHCAEYNACNQRVYFVKDEWYANEYAPRYNEQHGKGHGNGQGNQGEGHGNGHGKGHGKGHDKGDKD